MRQMRNKAAHWKWTSRADARLNLDEGREQMKKVSPKNLTHILALVRVSTDTIYVVKDLKQRMYVVPPGD